MVWDPKAVHQNFGSSGSYDANSALAQEYNAADEDSSSRVDDEAGWRQIAKDSPPKNAAEYEDLVNKWSSAGFEVKAIDMDGENFTNSNIAVKPKGSSSKPTEFDPKTMEMSPEYAHAKARVSQYKEDVASGRTAEELFGTADAGEFLDRYKMKLGERLENGNYRPPQMKDVGKPSEKEQQGIA